MDKKITMIQGRIIKNTQLPKIVPHIIKMVGLRGLDSMVGFKHKKFLMKGESYGEYRT